MDFELDPMLKGVQGALNAFAKFQMRPNSRKYDEIQQMPWPVMKQAAKMGMSMSGSMGKGGGIGAVDTGESKDKGDKPKNPLAANQNLMSVVGGEELAWGCAGIALALAGSGLAATPVSQMGTPEQKKVFFDAMEGETEDGHPQVAAMGITEPNAGSDISSIKTTAIKDGDYYVLNGTKRFITNGYSANVFVIWATLDPSLGREAYRSFVITRDTPGLIPGKKEDKLGIRASETAEVYMEDCRVHKDMMMGDTLEAAAEKKKAAGFSGAKAMFDSTRPMVGSMGVGIGRSAYDFAVEWCQKHKRGGKYLYEDPIVRHRLAAVKARLDAARYLVWRSAWMADQKIGNVKEASMGKAYGAQAGYQACSEAVDICGPEALSREFLLEKMFRDIKIFDIFEGTGQIQRRIVARELTGLKAQ